MDIGQVKYLSDGLQGLARSLVFDDLTELAIVAFNRVGGVNHKRTWLKECGGGYSTVGDPLAWLISGWRECTQKHGS